MTQWWTVQKNPTSSLSFHSILSQLKAILLWWSLDWIQNVAISSIPVCSRYARHSGKHFKCFISLNSQDNPIIFSIFQMGLSKIKQFAQDAAGTKIQSQVDGPDGRVQPLTVTAYCRRQGRTIPELTKGTCTPDGFTNTPSLSQSNPKQTAPARPPTQSLFQQRKEMKGWHVA